MAPAESMLSDHVSESIVLVELVVDTIIVVDGPPVVDDDIANTVPFDALLMTNGERKRVD